MPRRRYVQLAHAMAWLQAYLTGAGDPGAGQPLALVWDFSSTGWWHVMPSVFRPRIAGGAIGESCGDFSPTDNGEKQ